MKTKVLFLVAALASANAIAQNINPEVDNLPDEAPVVVQKSADSLFSGWAIDVNLTGGMLTQNLSVVNMAAQYNNPISPNIGTIKFNNGMSYGIDGEIDRFFGKKHHFGVGVGLWYYYQQGNATLNNFNIQYQSQDNFGNTFRQEITADNQIKENLNISNFNIPIMLKYKTKFSKKWGFTADAGLLVNLTENFTYNTNASFDYEAIYDYVADGSGSTAVFDNAATPASSDVLITKAQYLTTHTQSELQSYFSTLKSEGYNVGLGVKPNNTSGTYSYKMGSLGFLVRPAISYYLSNSVALNAGVYYTFQDFNNSASGYQLTNKVGSYTSVVGAVKTAANSDYGVSVGVRFFFNNRERTEVEAEPPVSEDKDVDIAPAPAPVQSTPAGEDSADQEESSVDVSGPILFDLNRIAIKPASYPILEEAAREVKEDKGSYIEINGYTDITGTALYNLALSKKRAMVVKNYLKKKGVSPRAMKTIGHGAKSPAASNKTRAGRAQNRRVVMKIKKKS